MISDINKDLIKTFKAVRDNPQELIKHLRYLKNKNSKEFYYKVRKKFNENKIEGVRRCAAFIYLNKTCFNGLYRVNSQGEFNVPCGKYKNPEIFNERNILFASKLLQGAKIVCQDYGEIKKYVEKEDFVYLDPCYDPLKKESFVDYIPKKFTNEYNERLRIFVAELKRRGIKIILSNNVTKNVRKLYPTKEFNRIVVYCSRSINCVGNQRGEIKEYLILPK